MQLASAGGERTLMVARYELPRACTTPTAISAPAMPRVSTIITCRNRLDVRPERGCSYLSGAVPMRTLPVVQRSRAASHRVNDRGLGFENPSTLNPGGLTRTLR